MNAQSNEAPTWFGALDTSKAEIRILNLRSGSPEAPVLCEHQVVNLDDDAHPQYETLSYAWHDGVDGEQCTITLNGLPFEVTSSLFGAMKELRLPDRDRHVWIDQICINQSDMSEKTSQVNMMGRIYKLGEQCIFWLGPLKEVPLNDAQDLMDIISFCAGVDPRPSWAHDSPHCLQIAKTLGSFMNRAWWSRIWTVQEVLLPRRAMLYWGPCRIDWDLMDKAGERLCSPKLYTNIPYEFMTVRDGNDRVIDRFTHQVRGLSFTREESLLRILWRWRIRGATEQHDKVYALMGLRDKFPSMLPSVPSCDYNIDIRTLFSRVTIDLIRGEGDLKPLIGRRGSKFELGGLPSWALDVTQQFREIPQSDFWTHYNVWGWRGYTASRGISWSSNELRVIDERVLILRGLFVDKIAVVERKSEVVEDYRGLPELSVLRAPTWRRLVHEYRSWRNEHGYTDDKGLRSQIDDLRRLTKGHLVPNWDADNEDEWTYNMVRPQALFFTEQGRVGLGPLNMTPGQEVWIVGGCRFPVILERIAEATPSTDGQKEITDCKFLADCFVYGVMSGEYVDEFPDRQVGIALY